MHSDSNDLDAQLDQLLQRTHAAPSMAFEAALERRLLPSHRSRRGVAGLIAASASLAAVVLIASLAGGGPLASHGGSNAKAKPGCTTVYVTKVQSSGQVVRKPDGTVTVETATKPVSHEQQRCR